MLNRRRFVISATSAIAGSKLYAAEGDDFPTKPIRLMVPFAAGGFSDVLGRLIGVKMGEVLGVPVVVENRTGAGGIIGAAAVAQAPADGYSILQGNNGVFTVLPLLQKDIGYDTWRDFLPLSLTQATPIFLTVNTAVFKAKNWIEFKAEVNALPESSPLRSYASPGVASTHHLAMELLKSRTGIKLIHVPYRGSAPANQDLIAGRTPVAFTVFTESNQYVSQGKLRYIGSAYNIRSTDLPDVPTLAEQGVTGFNAIGWQALAVRTGTPAKIVAKLHAAYAAAASDAGVRQKLATMGVSPLITTPSEALAHMRADGAQWAEVIKSANITLTQ